MASVVESGNPTLVVGTATTVSTTLSEDPANAKVYVICLDLRNLADGATPDILEVTVQVAARDADTIQDAWTPVFVGDQAVKWVESIPVFVPPSTLTFRLILKQTQGTGRQVFWSINEA